MKTRLHACAGAIGFLTILVFMSSTLAAELFGSSETIAQVKRAILWGLLVMIPTMAIVGGSGFSLAAGRVDGLVTAKKRRMPIIGANGLLVLTPLAFLLESRASADQFDSLFYIMQAAEFIAGAVNLTLMGLNMRDGFALTGRGKTTHAVQLLDRADIASNTLQIRLSRPAGFEHKPGQWVRLTLVGNAADDAARPLSIVSAPHEPHLTLATRISDSEFKQRLKALAVGADLHLTGPNGDFALDPNSDRPLVFIAGGIGITPFISMIRAAFHNGDARQITLFYSNRDPASAAYLGELQELDIANQNFRLITTMTSRDNNLAWTGETGFVDQSMLDRHLSNALAARFYCVGPTAMVTSSQTMLQAFGVSTGDIVTEAFAGY